MRVNCDVILEMVCAYFNLSPESLFKNSRKKEIINARHIYLYLCYRHSGKSLTEVGKHFKDYLGCRAYDTSKCRSRDFDHATVLHAYNKIKVFKEVYAEFAKHVEEVEKMSIQEMEKNFFLIQNPEIDLLKIAIENTINQLAIY